MNYKEFVEKQFIPICSCKKVINLLSCDKNFINLRALVGELDPDKVEEQNFRSQNLNGLVISKGDTYNLILRVGVMYVCKAVSWGLFSLY